MERVETVTADITAENKAKLLDLFPQIATEVEDENGKIKSAVDFDALRDLLGDVAEGQRERYLFTWPGKAEAKAEARRPITKIMRPQKEKSMNWDDTQNLYIEGDNLDALKILKETYAGKVKLIYIDPPYNTGHDFVYDDDFAKTRGEYDATSGDYDEDGGRLVANTEGNGRFHSDWCSMMYPRLILARDLLSVDGYIAISIDDNELCNLRKLCDGIFGAANFVDTVIWKKRYGGGPKEKYLVTLQDYVLIYARDLSSINDITVPLSDDSIARYYTRTDSNFSKRGPYRTHPLEANKTLDARPNLVFPIPTPDGNQVWPKRQWLWGKERVDSALKNGELEFVRDRDGKWSVQTKQYLRHSDGSLRRGKLLSIIDDVYTQHGTNEMIDLFGNAKMFPYPKPTAFLKQIFGIVPETDALFLDFFAGSGSTADAIMQMNAEDDGSRKCILVQIPETCDEGSVQEKAGYRFITEIGEERIRRAGAKISAEVEETNRQLKIGEEPKPVPDIGFRVLRIDSSNFRDTSAAPDAYDQATIFDMADNLKEDRTPLDLLFQVLPVFRIPYSARIDEVDIAGKKVFVVNDGQLVACFDLDLDNQAIERIARMEPVYAVFRDASLKDDATAANLEELFKTYSPDTVRKVI